MGIAEFSEETTTQLLKGIDIPPQPQVLRIAMAEQVKEFPDLKKISAAVAKDVSLSAAMLKAANSPAFQMRQKVTSINSAVMSLGTNNVIGLITGLSLRMVMSGKKSAKLDSFWNNASDAAVVCSLLGYRFNVMPPDEGYTLGLFHNAGIPLLMQRFPDYLDDMAKARLASKDPATTIEDYLYNTNHGTGLV